MKTRALKDTMSVLCLALQLSGGVLTAGRVLCVAADGHLALEPAHSGACTTEIQRHHDAHANADAALAACGDHPCTDLTLIEPLWRSPDASEDHARLARLPALAFLPDSDAPPLLRLTLASFAESYRIESKLLRARRSVVILV